MTQQDRNPAPKEVATILKGTEFEWVLNEVKERIRSTIRAGEHWALVGVKRRGSLLARRFWTDFRDKGLTLDFGEVDISLYRDDYHLQLNQPRVLGTEISFEVDGCNIILVDDVLYTGRTVRAAIDQILDFGRPRTILLAVLIDRGHRELPIAPDVTGRRISTQRDDRIQVRLKELDGEDKVSHVQVE